MHVRWTAALLAAALVALCASSAAARHAVPGDLLPHPRIWLDAPTLKTLRARAKQGTKEWKALKKDCDAYLKGTVQYPDGNTDPETGIGEGYQGSGYFSALLDLGLCYLAAPKSNAKYSARGADVLAKMSNPTHAPDPLRDAGYGIRFYGVTMAVGFDWLYPALTAALRAQVIASLHTWIDAYERGGFENDFPQGNYFAGYYDAKALAALATEGDDPQAAADWQDWLTRVHGSFVQPYYAANLSGGGWPEGWNYGPLATLNMTWPVDAARTAKGLNLLDGYTFALNSPRFIVSFTWPSLKTMDDAGAEYDGDNPSATSPQLATAEAGLLSRFGDPFAPYMHSYARAVRAGQPDAQRTAAWGRWIDFLYWDPKAPERDFRTLPLSYFAPGMDDVAMRSSWKADAVWASFKGGPYTNSQGSNEEFFDEGSLAIVDGSKQYLVNATTALQRNTPGTDDGSRFGDLIYDDLFSDTGARDLFNVFYVSSPQPLGQSDYLRSEGARTTTTFVDHGAYAVARATHLEDLYPRDRGADKTITTWTRDVVYIRPATFVVHDRTDVTDASLDQWLAWHFLGKPAALADGRYQVSAGTVQPLGSVTGRLVNVFNSNKVYRLEVRSTDTATHHDWFTVLEAGGGAAGTLSGATVRVGSTAVTFREDGTVSVST